jgi:Ran GTPase-activating protein (RanGAP) involved in mRNA processing and transport
MSELLDIRRGIADVEITTYQLEHCHITHKSLKSNSKSDWASIMKIANKNLNDTFETNNSIVNEIKMLAIKELLNKIVKQLLIDEEHLNNGNLECISDCALHAPRDYSSNASKSKPIKLSSYCAKVMFIDNGKMRELLHAKIHWQRLIATLSRAYVDEQIRKAVQEQQYKTARLLQHQRKGWCELKKKTIAVPIGKPTAMPVDIAPLDELLPLYEYLSKDITFNIIPHLEFKRGAIYPDGRMDLCKQVVGDKWIEQLMSVLKTNSQIKHFLLGNNITGLEGGKSIGKYLANQYENANKIITWYLAGCDLTSEALGYIVDGFIIGQDVSCNALWLKRNPIYSEGIKHIRRLLENNSNIKILDLHNTGIGLSKNAYNDKEGRYEQYLTDNGISDLCEGLKINTTLRHLYLDANALGLMSAQILADYFKFKINCGMQGISSLWIDMNKLGDDGVNILCDVLRDYPYIKRLNLGSNYISERGMQYITDAFKNHTKLKVLDVSLYKSTANMGSVPNNIGDNGVPAICELIENNKSIRYFNISMNNISNDGINRISDALEMNTSIWYFHYSQYGNEISQSVIQKINNILERNRSLEPNITFSNEHIRILKHSNKIVNIDSIYRNSMK